MDISIFSKKVPVAIKPEGGNALMARPLREELFYCGFPYLMGPIILLVPSAAVHRLEVQKASPCPQNRSRLQRKNIFCVTLKGAIQKTYFLSGHVRKGLRAPSPRR